MSQVYHLMLLKAFAKLWTFSSIKWWMMLQMMYIIWVSWWILISTQLNCCTNIIWDLNPLGIEWIRIPANNFYCTCFTLNMKSAKHQLPTSVSPMPICSWRNRFANSWRRSIHLTKIFVQGSLFTSGGQTWTKIVQMTHNHLRYVIH